MCVITLYEYHDFNKQRLCFTQRYLKQAKKSFNTETECLN